MRIGWWLAWGAVSAAKVRDPRFPKTSPSCRTRWNRRAAGTPLLSAPSGCLTSRAVGGCLPDHRGNRWGVYERDVDHEDRPAGPGIRNDLIDGLIPVALQGKAAAGVSRAGGKPEEHRPLPRPDASV
jgi:hypothetical protein